MACVDPEGRPVGAPLRLSCGLMSAQDAQNLVLTQDDVLAVLSLKGELVALGEAVMTSEQVMAEQKGFAVKITKVFMLPGTYPKS